MQQLDSREPMTNVYLYLLEKLAAHRAGAVDRAVILEAEQQEDQHVSGSSSPPG